MKKTILLLCSICFVCFGNNLLSQTILNSNFSTYTVGDLSGSNGWSNSTSNPGGTGGCTGVGCLNNRVTATAINYTGFGSSTKSISVGPNQDGTGVGFTAVSANSIYIAVVVNFSAVPSTESDILRIMNGGNFNVSARIAVKSSGTGFIVGVGKTTSTVVYKSTPTILPLNTSHLLILKYSFVAGSTTDDIVSVITNPDLLYAEPAAEVATSLGNDVTTAIDRMNLPFNAASRPVGNMGTINISTNWIGGTVVAASPFAAFNISKDRNNFITLNWDVHDPSLIYQFIVEQSDNAVSFGKIGEQTATAFKHYSHPIISPITSCYFRIKLILKDGSIVYSNVIKYSSSNKTKLSVYPIPAKTDLQVKLTLLQDEWITYSIINMQGMPVIQKKQFLVTGDNFINVNIENLAPQSYALVIQGTNTNERTIFIKQ